MVEVQITSSKGASGASVADAPPLGETLFILPADRAKEVAEQRQLAIEFSQSVLDMGDDDLEHLDDGDTEEEARTAHYVIVKTDTAASLSTVHEMVSELNERQTDIEYKLAHHGLGDMNESDIEMAAVAGSTVVLYNVKLPVAIQKQAARRHVKIAKGDVLHQLIAEALGVEATEGMPLPANRDN